MKAGHFGEWTIIPYQFPKSIAIAGNLAAIGLFFCGTFRSAIAANSGYASFYRMKLTPDELKRIAHLARITVSETDVATLKTQLNGIFGLIDELQAVDTKGIEPLSHPLDVIGDLAQRLREDRITESDARDANMANAPAQENGLFLVPKVLD
jgi:aspartyl-tRNA(Asn)/glutamyl-tRNA(Gln) amidotransferase subunit C